MALPNTPVTMTTVNDLQKPSPLMSMLLNQLNITRVSYEGGLKFKRLVIVKKPSESPSLYQDKLNNTASLPICKNMIEEITDIIFDEEPTRTIAFLNSKNNNPIDEPMWFDDFIDNADMHENTFTKFMEVTAQTAAVEGWAWVFADLPEEDDPSNRPYLTLIPAQRVLDWREKSEKGINTIVYLRVIEYQDDQIQLIKVWQRGNPKTVQDDGTVLDAKPTTATMYTIKLAEGTTSTGAVSPTDYWEFPPDYPIPVVKVCPVPDTSFPIIGVSDLTDIVDMQREWLRLESEAFDSIRFSKSIIRCDPGVKVPAGAGGIVRGLKDSMEVHEISGADIAQVRAQQAALITAFDGYTGRAGTRNIAEQVSSGISIVEERKSLHKKAQARARILERVEEQILNLVCYLMNVTWAGEIEYNTDYESRDTQFRLALYGQALALTQNPMIQQIIDEELLKLLAPPDKLSDYLETLAQQKLDWQTTNINDDLLNQNTSKTNADGSSEAGIAPSQVNVQTVELASNQLAGTNAAKGIAVS